MYVCMYILTFERADCDTVKKVKVKLYLCFNWAPRHEGVLGKWRYSPHSFLDLGTRWRWVVSVTPRPLYLPGKSLWYPLDRRLAI